MKTGRVIKGELTYSVDEDQAQISNVLDIMTFDSRYGYQFVFQAFDEKGGNSLILQETPDGRRVLLSEDVLDSLSDYTTNGDYYESSSASVTMGPGNAMGSKIILAWRPITWNDNGGVDFTSTVIMQGCWSMAGIR